MIIKKFQQAAIVLLTVGLPLLLSACGSTRSSDQPTTARSSGDTSSTQSNSEAGSPSSSSSSVSNIRGELTQIMDFGSNPGELEMHLYIPQDVQNSAPVLLAVHYCTGSGPEFYRNSQYKSLADTHGFIVIYPSVTRSSRCFDVASPAALTRDGGSDPVSLRSMIAYVQSHHNVNSNRIYVTGVSSGAMMTHVMLALYPDVFSAGAAFAGVPYQCFATDEDSGWSTHCADGTISRSAQEWGDLVRDAYPGYSGERPRIQMWHGTEDEVLSYHNFEEAIKQWTNVHGLSLSPDLSDSPSTDATRTRYGSSGENALVEAIRLDGVSHNLPVDAAEAIRFFNLNNESAY